MNFDLAPPLITAQLVEDRQVNAVFWSRSPLSIQDLYEAAVDAANAGMPDVVSSMPALFPVAARWCCVGFC